MFQNARMKFGFRRTGSDIWPKTKEQRRSAVIKAVGCTETARHLFQNGPKNGRVIRARASMRVSCGRKNGGETCAHTVRKAGKGADPPGESLRNRIAGGVGRAKLTFASSFPCLQVP